MPSDPARRPRAPARPAERACDPHRATIVRRVFDSLSDRLNATLTDLRRAAGCPRRTSPRAMREIRLALLEADVNFKVVREFVAQGARARRRRGVLTGLNPGQQVIKIVNEELAALMGTGAAKLQFALAAADRDPDGRPAGLRQDDDLRQAREAAREAGQEARAGGLRRLPARPRSTSCRPSASRSACRSSTAAPTPTRSRSRRGASQQARQQGRDVVIVDTAGRLHVDEELMARARARSATRSSRHDDAARARLDDRPGRRQRRRGVPRARSTSTGIVLTKLDGDARGGAALSVRAVTGMPILFASVGEKLDPLEEFHPDRMASRILGMGDVLRLIERRGDGRPRSGRASWRRSSASRSSRSTTSSSSCARSGRWDRWAA